LADLRVRCCLTEARSPNPERFTTAVARAASSASPERRLRRNVPCCLTPSTHPTDGNDPSRLLVVPDIRRLTSARPEGADAPSVHLPPHGHALPLPPHCVSLAPPRDLSRAHRGGVVLALCHDQVSADLHVDPFGGVRIHVLEQWHLASVPDASPRHQRRSSSYACDRVKYRRDMRVTGRELDRAYRAGDLGPRCPVPVRRPHLFGTEGSSVGCWRFDGEQAGSDVR
jgi:hypothetical protein